MNDYLESTKNFNFENISKNISSSLSSSETTDESPVIVMPNKDINLDPDKEEASYLMPKKLIVRKYRLKK